MGHHPKSGHFNRLQMFNDTSANLPYTIVVIFGKLPLAMT